MDLLARAVPKLTTADHFGIPAVAKEALAFALLGAATLDKRTGEPAERHRRE
jgi:1,6-anhydro-N-acetylmuramate kinase